MMLQLPTTEFMAEEAELYNEVEMSSLLLFLAFYAVMSAYLEHKKLPLHRGAVAIIIGIAVGFFIFVSSQATYDRLVKMNETIIFTILLPPMLFAEGYTFKKNAFFKNLKYIVMFGVVGTFISFVAISGLIYAANDLNLVRDARDINVVRTLSMWEVLLFSACMCSIETKASEQAVDGNKYPKVYSILTGEGIMKDCVTIVLFRAILRLQRLESPTKFIFYWYTPFIIIKNFILLILGSLAFGIVAGMLTTYMIKKFRFLQHDKGVSETTVLFLIGYAVYILTEVATFSGIISILTFGFMLNRYNTHNLSEGGAQTSKNTFLFVSVISEGLLYLIMGVMVWEVNWDDKSPEHKHITHSYIFCMVVMLILLVGRTVNIYMVWLLSRWVSPSFKLKKQQLKIIFLSGLVRGATPFALFTSVQFKQGSTHYGHNEGLVLKSTIIIITMFSSIILNSLIPKLFSSSLAQLQSSAKQDIESKLKQEEVKPKSEWSIKSKSKFREFEQNKLKPLLIYDYANRKDSFMQVKHEEKVSNLRTTLEEMNKKEAGGRQAVEDEALKQSLLGDEDVV